MNKSVLENAQGSEELVAPAMALGEIMLGSLVAIDTSGNPLVSFPQLANVNALAAGSIAAISTVAISHQHLGRQVALLFVNGDLLKPVIVGFIYSPLFDLLENFSMLQNSDASSSEPSSELNSESSSESAAPLESSPLQTINVDGKRVVIEGQEEIVLSCGESSITLTKAGKILIRGKYLVSRSSGVNRILGGSVQIN
jgi:Domain of unknown function (DUF6484)